MAEGYGQYRFHTEVLSEEDSDSDIYPGLFSGYGSYRLPTEYYEDSDEETDSDGDGIFSHVDGQKHTPDDLQDLYDKAVQFAPSQSLHTCEWFYRNKDLAYFNKILQSDGIMKACTKDNNGDPRSPINGKLDGLFFTAGVKGKLPNRSPFGPRRLLVPADHMFESQPNVYFADFYCASNKANRPHYITLVMCETDSSADDFCVNHLLALPDYNPFLVSDNTGVKVNGSGGLWVEVFYTENLDINTALQNGATWQQTNDFGSGWLSGGIFKNPHCHICKI